MVTPKRKVPSLPSGVITRLVTHPRWLVALFSSTLFLSAFLLFSVQPIFAKMVLPMLGGTPAVWNTCMVFFQAVLLLGYSYAYLMTARLGVDRQVLLHVSLLILPLWILPLHIPSGWVPPVEANPILWLFGLLLVALGLPFFVISTSAPLLQQWFARTRHPHANDPYFLYAASNAGSLLALLSYPGLIEPHLRIKQQNYLWALGYGLLVVLLLSCAFTLWCSVKDPTRGPRRTTPPSHQPPSPRAKHVRRLRWSQRWRWVMLSFAPSSLLLGVTTYLSMDIAAIPLLWIIPLSLYLLTFILVFARKPLLPHALMIRVMPFVILPLVMLIISGTTRPTWLLIPLHLLMFFLTAMVCHGELAQDRPPAHQLTTFYFWMSIGGVLGGLFNALIAPVIFETVIEYPLVMVLACLLRPGSASKDQRPQTDWFDYLMPLVLGGLMAALLWHLHVGPGADSGVLGMTFICVPIALVCYSFRYRPVRFGLGVGAFLLTGLWSAAGREGTLHIERSFFGVYRVVLSMGRGDFYHSLLHGTTLHGMQSLDPSRRREPLTYYHPTGPIGEVFEVFDHRQTQPRVAAIGLGTGSIACYSQPGQQWTFYEIDPVVKRIATNPNYFTFVQDCLPSLRVVFGDARLSIARAPQHTYGLIIVDAFSSDAIPIHLITREALALYLAKLADHGLLAFHISSRYLDLAPVLGDLAGNARLVCLIRRDRTISERSWGKTGSNWVVMARETNDLGVLAHNADWQPIPSRPRAVLWTDDFSNLLSVFRWR